jgi:NADH-quinone oxidoreductase subunit I
MAYYTATRDPTTDIRERTFVPELLHGLAVTTRHFLRNLFFPRDTNPDVLNRKGVSQITTVSYPEERVTYPPGYRGLHRLVPRDDGKPRCVACYLCATICPAQCIHIEAGEYETKDASTESVIEKYPTRFVIDELRCIVCGLCVDACPKDAIRMDTGIHTPSEYTRSGFVWDIPRLLQGPAVSHPSDPWVRRTSSAEPPHQHLEKHSRVGEGLVQLKLPHGQPAHAVRTEVTSGPVPVTKFLRD